MKKRMIMIMFIGLFLLILPIMAAAEIVDSGSCGDNATWTLDDSGQMVISGTGKINVDMYFFSNIPGFSKLTIKEGITSTGTYAFYQCTNLTEVDAIIKVDTEQ